MFTKSFAHELKSTKISTMIPLQRGHNQRCVLSAITVVQNGFSLCELTWLKCILAVLFLFKILNRNRIMYGRKKKHTDLQSVPPTHSIFTVQTALKWRQAVTARLTRSFLPVVVTAQNVKR